MKKLTIIVLCICLLLCACAPSFSAAKGSVLDKDFIETFPFQSGSLGLAVDWFNNHNAYKIKDTDDTDGDFRVQYKGNVDWYILGTAGEDGGIPGVDGFYVIFSSDADYSEQDWHNIFNCAVDELTYMCGNPVDIWNEGDCMTFYYERLKIDITYVGSVSLRMRYEG